MSGALTRAVIVVFTEKTTDTEAALMRNGLNMFRGVQRVIPVRGVPTDAEARKLLSRETLAEENEALRRQCHELNFRLQQAQDAVSGPIPGLPYEDPATAAIESGVLRPA